MPAGRRTLSKLTLCRLNRWATGFPHPLWRGVAREKDCLSPGRSLSRYRSTVFLVAEQATEETVLLTTAAAAISAAGVSRSTAVVGRSSTAGCRGTAARFRSTASGCWGTAAGLGSAAAGLAAVIVTVLTEEPAQEALSLGLAAAGIWLAARFGGTASRRRGTAARFRGATARGGSRTAWGSLTTGRFTAIATVVLPVEQSSVGAIGAEARDHQGGSQSHPLHYGLLLEKSFFRYLGVRNSWLLWDTSPVDTSWSPPVALSYIAGNTRSFVKAIAK